MLAAFHCDPNLWSTCPSSIFSTPTLHSPIQHRPAAPPPARRPPRRPAPVPAPPSPGTQPHNRLCSATRRDHFCPVITASIPAPPPDRPAFPRSGSRCSPPTTAGRWSSHLMREGLQHQGSTAYQAIAELRQWTVQAVHPRSRHLEKRASVPSLDSTACRTRAPVWVEEPTHSYAAFTAPELGRCASSSQAEATEPSALPAVPV
ncbi:hypothetical protein B0H17DRAFT_1218997 [Mycena rosella]|uniref:Uncharacterized protein n=1 Tax=Mycena rosella TaxID=1033263 RepID=A0AAD7BL39_MYCRO|nr:hypothetical protein B0H17DRAFT_1218997 [Mycena rosella]